MTTPTMPEPWRCPRCDAERSAEDDFCGRCGARRPKVAPAGDGADLPAAPDKGHLLLVRALVLNGIIVVAVIVAVFLGTRDGGPATVTFEPATWRCDGTQRAWIATLPAKATDLRLDWSDGGPTGDVRATSTTTLAALATYRTPDGSFRVTTSSTDAAGAPECGLQPGTYTLAIRDATSGVLVASGQVDLGP